MLLNRTFEAASNEPEIPFESLALEPSEGPIEDNDSERRWSRRPF